MKHKVDTEKPGRDNPVWTKDTFARARPATEVLPDLVGQRAAVAMLKPRGRPKAAQARTAISLRLPPETLERWKATGPGWQTRMVEILAKAV